MSLTPDKDDSGFILRCEECDKAYKIFPEKLPSGISSFPCRACGTLIPISHPPADKTATDIAGEVLVVLEEEELGNLVLRILEESGYKGSLASGAREALDVLGENTYDILLLGVYLPDMMGYELLDKLKEKGGTDIPCILLSSIHHAARYKRAPTSLYGADDYLERHHIPDLLIPKIQRLLLPDRNEQPPVMPSDVPPPSDDQVQARRDLEAVESAEKAESDKRMGDLQRMCRVIVGDIALYNEDVISSTQPDDLLEAISADLCEGEALLLKRFPDMEDQVSHLLKGEMMRLLSTRGIEIP